MLQPATAKPAPATKPRKERLRVDRAERVPPNSEAASTATQVPAAAAPAPHVPAAPQEVRVLKPPAAKQEETAGFLPGQPAPHAAPTPSPPVEQAAPAPQVGRSQPQRPERAVRPDRPASTPPVLNQQKSDPGPSRGGDASRNRGAFAGGQRQGGDAPSVSGAQRAESVNSEPSHPTTIRGTTSLPEQQPSWGRGDSRGGRGGRGNRGRMQQGGARGMVQGPFVQPQMYYPPSNMNWYPPQGYPQVVPVRQRPYQQHPVEEALRLQIEYYFSIPNLVKVRPLRGRPWKGAPLTASA